MPELTQATVQQLLIEAGAEQRGHFRLASGRHSDRYLDKDSVSASTRITSLLCREVARHYSNYPVEVVVGPAYGAIVAAHVVAQQMNLRRDAGNQVIPVFAVREDNTLKIRKSMRRFVRGHKCLVMEDILTTGSSAKDTVVATIEAGCGIRHRRGGVLQQRASDQTRRWAFRGRRVLRSAGT